MADIVLIRADFRLIHGQVITKWAKQTIANKILIVDDMLAKDSFMSSIYTMSAPPGMEVVIDTAEDAVSKWNSGGYGNCRLFVLIKDVPTIYALFKGGFPVKELQIGGLGAAPGRKVVFGPITLDQPDAMKLKEMQDSGVRVYLHQVPDDPSMEFTKILEKKLFDI